MSSLGRRYLYNENKSFDLICEGRNTKCLRVCENGRGFRRSVFLERDEFRLFLEGLNKFWWSRKLGTWAKHLVKTTMSCGLHMEGTKEVSFLHWRSKAFKTRSGFSFRPTSNGKDGGSWWWLWTNLQVNRLSRRKVNPKTQKSDSSNPAPNTIHSDSSCNVTIICPHYATPSRSTLVSGTFNLMRLLCDLWREGVFG